MRSAVAVAVCEAGPDADAAAVPVAEGVAVSVCAEVCVGGAERVPVRAAFSVKTAVPEEEREAAAEAVPVWVALAAAVAAAAAENVPVCECVGVALGQGAQDTGNVLTRNGDKNAPASATPTWEVF